VAPSGEKNGHQWGELMAVVAIDMEISRSRLPLGGGMETYNAGVAGLSPFDRHGPALATIAGPPSGPALAGFG